MNDIEVLTKYSRFLTSIGVSHVVGGSLASSAWGEQRYTNDADLVLDLRSVNPKEFVEALPEGFHAGASDIQFAKSAGQSFECFQVMHETAAFKIDNFAAVEQWDYDRLERAVWLNLTSDPVPFSTAEDIVIAKIRWFDLGNRVSDRQFNDLARLVDVQGDALDRPYIEQWISHFGLLDVWQMVVESAQN